jgi:peptide/nickel transport system substrate-binding protein
MIVNRQAPPFDNPDLRHAMSLTIDRKAFIDILAEGQGAAGGLMQPPPDGLWGMPVEMLHKLPGYDPDVAKSRAEARRIMKKLGYGPDKRLSVTVSTRNLAPYRDPAVILIDQLREIYIDGVLDPIDTTQWYPTLMRKDYKVGVNVTETAVDDPDPSLYENYVCGAQRNYTGYCNPEIDKLIDQQSAESDIERRKRLVWEIERRLAQDDARPILFYQRAANCARSELHGLTTMANSIYNQSRFDDLWLERGIGSSAPR